MSERKHELTDDDLHYIIREARVRGRMEDDEPSIEQTLASLPSRCPADPDAGLGKLPWRGQEEAGDIDRGEFQTLRNANGDHIATVMVNQGEAWEPAAVARAILAAPEGIRLARKIAKHFANWPDVALDGPAREWRDLAASVLAIAEGRERS